MSTDLTPKL